MNDLARTPLHALHVSLGARMAPFAGYDMPISYPAGVLKEHLHTRASAGLFDVSHMGQIVVRPRSGGLEDAAAALEALAPADFLGLPEGRQRYVLLTAEGGGVFDDVMVTNRGDHLLLVVNASRKAVDLARLEAALGGACAVSLLDRALLALQGPQAQPVLSRLQPDVAHMRFMEVWDVDFHGVPAVVARSGYTGEDGYEISLAPRHAAELAERLLAAPEVLPVGLGARDSLRLEAGLCLFGRDIDETTTPVEAALEWTIPPVRRRGGARAGGFPGAETILGQIEAGATRRRVGLLPEGRAPMRDGVELFADPDGPPVGRITSGGFGPSLNRPVAMGYVSPEHAAPGAVLQGRLRGVMAPVKVAATPLVKPGYRRD